LEQSHKQEAINEKPLLPSTSAPHVPHNGDLEAGSSVKSNCHDDSAVLLSSTTRLCHLESSVVKASSKSPASPKRSRVTEGRCDTLEWDGFGTDAESSSAAVSSLSSSPPSRKNESEFGCNNIQPLTFAGSAQNMDGYMIMMSPKVCTD
jgi:hypothetical protein